VGTGTKPCPYPVLPHTVTDFPPCRYALSKEAGVFDCPSPSAFRPTFESKLARLEYVGDGKIGLAYTRHTAKWREAHTGLSADRALAAVLDDRVFLA
jgi:hypothetical protein